LQKRFSLKVIVKCIGICIAFCAIILFIKIVFSNVSKENTVYREKRNSEIDRFFEGEHNLEELSIYNEKESHSGYFLLCGSSKSYESNKVLMLWQMNNGEYSISKIPLDKVRLSFKDVKTPSIKFKYYYNSEIHKNDCQFNVDYNVIYVLITCNKKDWSLKEGIKNINSLE